MSRGNFTSIWSATANVPATTYDRLNDQVEADVAIIGGGYCGLSTALHLAEAGVSVCLLEAETIGFGASGRNGGHANPGFKFGQDILTKKYGDAGRGMFRMGEEAVDFLADLIARKNLNCRFRRPGVIRLAHSPYALQAAKEAYQGLVDRGIPARFLSADEASELVGSRRYLGGLIDPRAGNLHPLDLSRELARAAAEAGVRVYTNSRVTALTPKGDRWQVTTPSGHVLANQVVVATNAYTEQLIPGLAASVVPVNSFQVATEPVDGPVGDAILPGGHAVYDSRRLVLYFRKTPEGRVMVGGRASFSGSANDQRDAGDYSVLERVVSDIFPSLKGVPIVYRWTGLVCITPDFLPHYHVPAPGLHVALGFNGRGVAMANRVGAWLANTLTGREDTGGIPETPISPIPFHAFRRPALDVYMRWNAWMDKLGR